jgi:hypothetical protein
MDELTPEQIDAWLAMLREHQVEEFEGQAFRVKFAPGSGPRASKEEATPAQVKPAPRSVWEDPSLWQGGEVPTFPKKNR